jgi:hypothetical protein
LTKSLAVVLLQNLDNALGDLHTGISRPSIQPHADRTFIGGEDLALAPANEMTMATLETPSGMISQARSSSKIMCRTWVGDGSVCA